MADVTSLYEVQLWNDEQWEIHGKREATFDEAERRMLSLLDSRTPHGRVIEVRTEVTRRLAIKATYAGVTDAEIVRNVVASTEVGR